MRLYLQYPISFYTIAAFRKSPKKRPRLFFFMKNDMSAKKERKRKTLLPFFSFSLRYSCRSFLSLASQLALCVCVYCVHLAGCLDGEVQVGTQPQGLDPTSSIILTAFFFFFSFFSFSSPSSYFCPFLPVAATLFPPSLSPLFPLENVFSTSVYLLRPYNSS